MFSYASGFVLPDWVTHRNDSDECCSLSHEWAHVTEVKLTDCLVCRWYYAKAMETDEVYVFVCYDSREDGRARFTPHTSFDDPTCPPDAPERESIEIRAYAFWQNDADGHKHVQ